MTSGVVGVGVAVVLCAFFGGALPSIPLRQLRLQPHTDSYMASIRSSPGLAHALAPLPGAEREEFARKRHDGAQRLQSVAGQTRAVVQMRMLLLALLGF